MRKTAQDFDCSTRTVKRDLDNIHEWIYSMFHSEVFEVENYKTLNQDVSEIMGLLYRLHDTAKSNLSLYILNSLLDIIFKQMDIVDKLGFIRQFKRMQEQQRQTQTPEINTALQLFRQVRQSIEEKEKNETKK